MLTYKDGPRAERVKKFPEYIRSKTLRCKKLSHFPGIRYDTMMHHEGQRFISAKNDYYCLCPRISTDSY